MAKQGLQKSKGNIILYQSDDGKIKVDVILDQETVRLTQEQIAALYNRDQSVISKHIKNAVHEGELDEKSIMQKMHIAHSDKPVIFYNLDVIISVGYRVKSIQGIQFRTWATQRLKEYLLQGFSLNEEKLKSGEPTQYFDKLQEKLREIRLSERLFYQKIKDIYTTSIDYNPNDEQTILFFKTVQNKLLRAISEQTAAELVYARINSNLPFLGMKSYDKNSENQITKKDVGIAKNYLNEEEIKILGLLVEQYFAFAESMAQAQIPMRMVDWIQRLDLILQMNKKEILTNAGKISHELAMEKAEIEYQKNKNKKKAIEKKDSIQELENDIKKIS